jgi:Tol biopolymer transport system component
VAFSAGSPAITIDGSSIADRGGAMSKATQDGERQPGRAAVIGCAIAFGALVLAAPGAEATYPGIPGRIAVSKPDRFANYHLATVSPRTPRLKQLTRSPRSCRSRNRTWMDDQPSYSADGRTIVYSHYDDCSSRMADGIYRMRSNGTGRKLLVRSRYTSEVEWPALSPSGRLLAWVVLTGPYEEPEGAIRVAPLRRLSDHVTLEHAGVDFQPSWSSRGRLVATAFDGVSEFSASGAQLGVVAGGAGTDWAPDWAPRGPQIAFDRLFRDERGDDVYVVSADGTGLRQFTRSGDSETPVWSPDGGAIAFLRDRDRNGIGSLYVKPVAGGTARLLKRNLDTERISWQPLPKRGSH